MRDWVSLDQGHGSGEEAAMVGSEMDSGDRTDRTSQWLGHGGVGKEGI